MAAGHASTHVCSHCGHASPQVARAVPGLRRVEHARRGGAAARRRRQTRAVRGRGAAQPVLLADVEAPAVARLATGIGELDRVLGGGLVPGSLVLLGGSPGIGKSTLTAMALGNLAAAGPATLYVTGRGVGGAGEAARRAARAGRARVPIAGRDRPRRRARHDRGRAARGVRHRLGADAARRGAQRSAPAPSARCARWPTASRAWPSSATSPSCSSAT